MSFLNGFRSVFKTAGLFSRDEPEGADYAVGAGQGAVGLALLDPAKHRIMGTKRMYHGTPSFDALESILREGLRADRGGTGLSQLDPDYIEESVGKVHVSPSKYIANWFTSPLTEEAGEWRPNLSLFQHPQTVSMDVPYHMFSESFERDSDFWPDEPGRIGRFLNKHLVAARTTEDIAPEFIRESDARNTLSALRRTIGDLPTYVRRHPGRFALGVGTLGGAGALFADAMDRIGWVDGS